MIDHRQLTLRTLPGHIERWRNSQTHGVVEGLSDMGKSTDLVTTPRCPNYALPRQDISLLHGLITMWAVIVAIQPKTAAFFHIYVVSGDSSKDKENDGKNKYKQEYEEH